MPWPPCIPCSWRNPSGVSLSRTSRSSAFAWGCSFCLRAARNLAIWGDASDNLPGVPGLGILKGTIRRIPDGPGLKIPHIGWNSLRLLQKDGLFAGLEEEPYVYFVHSYYLRAEDRSVVSAQTEYGVAIDAAVRRGSLNAVQFHPEKSGKTGLAMLKNFAGLL